MFDSHCHLHDERLADERQALLARARAAGVRSLLLAGVDRPGWQLEAALAKDDPQLFLSFGVHPLRVAALDDPGLEEELAALEQALTGGSPTLPRPHALGELGLDARPLYRPSLERQQRAFRQQLALGRRYELPLCLHIVHSHGEALRILKADGVPRRGGVVHSYSGAPALIADYLRLGLHISFSGALCAPQSSRLAAAARLVPLERLLVETDAPDQTPWPRRPGPNQPAFLVDVIAALAIIRGEREADLAAATDENARRLFGASPPPKDSP